MDYDVLKPFNTVNRRFKPDDDRCNVARSSDDLSPHSIETLEKRGFIKARDQKRPVTPPANELDTTAPSVPVTSER